MVTIERRNQVFTLMYPDMRCSYNALCQSEITTVGKCSFLTLRSYFLEEKPSTSAEM